MIDTRLRRAKDILTRVIVIGGAPGGEDGDGSLLTEADVQEILDTADVNGDGQLSIEEFVGLMKSRHASQLSDD